MEASPQTVKPKVLILATLSGGYAGADAVGQLHASYPCHTYILPVRDPAMFPERFYLETFERGTDGILVRFSGTDNPYRGGSERVAALINQTYPLMRQRDALTMERLLAPTGPYGHVLRPGDGKEPASIAYVRCAGSRDITLGVEYCSRVCRMYAIKQAMLLSGALPMADITIYYMDIRAFGKGYEQFYQNAKAMGVQFVKASQCLSPPGHSCPGLDAGAIHGDGRSARL